MTPSFVLFVTGHNARSLAAATNLRRVCDERFGAGAYDLYARVETASESGFLWPT